MSFYLTLLVAAFIGGLIVGWCVLPAPQWVTNLWRSAFNKPPLVVGKKRRK